MHTFLLLPIPYTKHPEQNIYVPAERTRKACYTTSSSLVCSCPTSLYNIVHGAFSSNIIVVTSFTCPAWLKIKRKFTCTLVISSQYVQKYLITRHFLANLGTRPRPTTMGWGKAGRGDVVRVRNITHSNFNAEQCISLDEAGMSANFLNELGIDFKCF